MADLTVSSSLVQAAESAPFETGIAAVQINAGQGVYLDGAENRIKLAIATGQASAAARGIATVTVSSGQIVRFQTDEALNLGGGVSVGQTYAVSTVAGGIAPITDMVAGNFVTLYGVGTSTNNLTLNVFRSGVAKA